MCVHCRGNMCETDNGRTTYIPFLLYGKIISHRSGTGHMWKKKLQDKTIFPVQIKYRYYEFSL